MTKTVDMTVGSPTKHMLTFALPLLITNIGQQLYMIADAAIVGRGVGVKALAAVGSTDWIYWLVLWAVIGLTQGFSTFISHSFGDKNYSRMNKVIATSIVLAAIVGTVLTVAGILSARPLLILLKTPPDILDSATLYLTTMLAGTLIITAYNMVSSILRAFGDGKTPLVAMIIAGVLNVGLDLLFVFVFQWGVFGAALASLIAQFVSFIFCFVQIKKVECVCIKRSDFILDGTLVKEMLLFSLPITLQYVIISTGGIFVQIAANAQGSIFVAGYTAANKAYGILESTSISLGHACATFYAQNYGAGLYERVRKGVGTSLRIVAFMALVVSTSVLLAREYILQIFLDVTEEGGPEALVFGARYLAFMAACVVIMYLNQVYKNVLQAMQISVWSLVAGIAEFALRIVMSMIVIRYMGADAIFASEPLAWLVGLLCVMLPYFFYRKRLYSDKSQA